MGEGPTIDARMQAALARLTDNEKECLRRRLRQQTAKEMALDLGVSPHAVEKRLKMARTKLGLSSSLEAARLLAVSEGYQRTGPQSTDLDDFPKRRDTWLTRPSTLGALAMSILAAVLLAVAMQGQGETTKQVDTSVYDEMEENPDGERSITELQFVKASPERVRAYVRQMFDASDKDGSGFIEPAEAPLRLAAMKPRQAGEPVRPYRKEDVTEEWNGAEAQRRYISNVDKDDDGRVSFAEYADPVMPQYLELGIPLVPADWTSPRSETEKPG